jgi:uncharacterized membrane protein
MFVSRRFRYTTLGPALLFAICLVSSGRASQPGFTTIDGPNVSFSTIPLGINNEGDIVGAYSNGYVDHGFLLSKGKFTIFDAPGAKSLGTVAVAINDEGNIVG